MKIYNTNLFEWDEASRRFSISSKKLPTPYCEIMISPTTFQTEKYFALESEITGKRKRFSTSDLKESNFYSDDAILCQVIS